MKNVKCLTPPTRLGWLLLFGGLRFLKKCKQKNTKWFFLGSLLLLIGVVCYEKTVRKKWSTSLLVGLVCFGLAWLGLAWFGLAWLGLVALGCWLVEKCWGR